MPRKLRDAVVVITGASSGIGRAAAQEFARRGASLVLAARSEEPLRQATAECQHLGARALAVPTDVTDKLAVQRLARQAIENFGRLDVWVNNAAVTLFARFDEASLDAYRQVIETNLFGYIHGARAALPYFHEQGGGVLINVASIVTKTPQPFTSAYDVSKSGIWALSQSLREELMLDGGDIHVCTILPATIDTPLFQHAANYSGRAVQPMPPIYSAEQVASAVVKCAERPQREVSIGGVCAPFSLLHMLAPGLTERLIAQQVNTRHLTSKAADPTPGNLFQPMPHWDKLSGGWQQTHQSMVRRVFVGGLAALVSAVAGWLWWRRPSRRQMARGRKKAAQTGASFLRRAA